MSDGRLNVCKSCQAEQGKIRQAKYALDPEKVAQKAAYRATPEYKANLRMAQDRWRKKPENHEKIKAQGRVWMKQHQVELRAEFIKEYGGFCVCCGEDEEQFLTVEHLNHDGAEHREAVGANVLPDLKRRGWPKDTITIMCMNCNWGRRFGGECPHSKFKLVSLVEAL